MSNIYKIFINIYSKYHISKIFIKNIQTSKYIKYYQNCLNEIIIIIIIIIITLFIVYFIDIVLQLIVTI